MADYDTDVGIQIDSDTERAIQNLRLLLQQVERIEPVLKSSLSSINNFSKGLKNLGNINLGNIDSKINTTINKINNLNNALEKIKADRLRDVITMLNGISLVVRNIDESGIKNLKQLPKAMESLQALDTSKIGNIFSTLAQEIQPFLSQLKEAESELQNFATITSSLKSMNTSLSKATNEIINLGNQSSKAHKKVSKLFNVGSMMYFFNMTRYFSEKIFSILEKPIDFAETENKFSVALGRMRDKAYKFQNDLTEAFGLDMSGTMEAQATFENMLSSMTGLSDNMSEQLSETLTKMSIDFASLYNTSIDSAYTKMQSALSRQVRPIRSVSGYDITQNVLGDSLKQMGIYDRTISQLSEMEKRLVIIYTLQQQMTRSGAMGDFARTIEQPAQQLKILQEQIKQVGRWLGAVFVGTIGKILPYINAFVMVIKELIKSFAFFVGYKMPNSSGLSNVLDQMDDSSSSFSDNIDNANAGLDKTKKKVQELTAPFDKLNIISEPKDTSSDDSSGGLGSIDSRILNALKDYDMQMDYVKMKATQIRDKIMEWLGFTKLVDEETGEVTYKLKDGFTNIEKIGLALGTIVGLIAGIKVVGIIGDAIKWFDALKIAIAGGSVELTGFQTTILAVYNAISGLSISIPTFLGIFAAISACILVIVDLYNKSKEFKNLVLEAIDGISSVLTNIYENVLKPLFYFIDDVYKTILEPLASLIKDVFYKAVEFLASILLGFFNDIIIPIANFLADIFAVVLQKIIDIWEKWKPTIQYAIDSLRKLWDEVLSPFVDFLKDTFLYIFEKIGDFIGWLAPYIVDLFGWVLDFFVGVFTGDFSSFIDGFMGLWNDAVDFIFDIFEPVGDFFADCWEDIQNAFGNVSGWFKDTFTKAWTAVKNVFSSGGKIFDGIKDGILNGLKSVVNALISGINKVVSIPFNGLNTALKKIRNVDILGFKPFDWIKTISVPQIPKLEKGGFVPKNIGQLFIANEPGNPELVGNIGGRTAVVNNQMILEGIEGAMTNAIIKGFQQVRIEKSDGTIIIENYYDGELIERKVVEANERHKRITGKLLFE